MRASKYYGGATGEGKIFMKFCIGAAWERGKVYDFLLSFHTVVIALHAAAKRM